MENRLTKQEKFYKVTKNKILSYKMLSVPMTNEKFLKTWKKKLKSLKKYKITYPFWYAIENKDTEDICIKFYTTAFIGRGENRIRTEWFNWTYAILEKEDTIRDPSQSIEEHLSKEEIIKFI